MGHLRVAVIGTGFMGAVHTRSAIAAGGEVVGIVGSTPAKGRQAAERFGAGRGFDSIEDVLRFGVDVVHVCTPNATHAEFSRAALDAGVPVVCEKPLATDARTARELTALAAERDLVTAVPFVYRYYASVREARARITDPAHRPPWLIHGSYLQDWLVDPEFPLTWRLRKELAGSGALGDLGAHIVDLAQYLAGERLTGVSALTETFVRERPLPIGASSGLASVASAGTGQVTVDDAALFTGRFASGAIASFEATRYATGRKNALCIELNGESGSLAFDLERLNELSYHDGTEPGARAGFRRILVTEPDHPYLDAWWPPGHGLGYEHTFVHQARDLVHAIAEGRRPEPSFADGLQVQRVLAAVEESAEKNSVYTPIAD